MRTTRALIHAIAIAGGLLATTQCFALCGYKPGSPLPRHQTPVPTYTDAALPTPIATEATPVPAPVPDRSPVSVPSYAASSATTAPIGNAVGNGSMSGGIGAGGAMVAASARAGNDRSTYCRRSGRSQTMVDACLKLAGAR